MFKAKKQDDAGGLHLSTSQLIQLLDENLKRQKTTGNQTIVLGTSNQPHHIDKAVYSRMEKVQVHAPQSGDERAAILKVGKFLKGKILGT